MLGLTLIVLAGTVRATGQCSKSLSPKSPPIHLKEATIFRYVEAGVRRGWWKVVESEIASKETTKYVFIDDDPDEVQLALPTLYPEPTVNVNSISHPQMLFAQIGLNNLLFDSESSSFMSNDVLLNFVGVRARALHGAQPYASQQTYTLPEILNDNFEVEKSIFRSNGSSVFKKFFADYTQAIKGRLCKENIGSLSIQRELGGIRTFLRRIGAGLRSISGSPRYDENTNTDNYVRDSQEKERPCGRIWGIPPTFVGLALYYGSYLLCFWGWNLFDDHRYRRARLWGSAILGCSAVVMGLGGSLALFGIWW